MNITPKLSAAIPRQISYRLSDFRGDFFGGLTATGIALPVAMGYGVISGLGPAAGLYGTVAVGIFASIFGGVRGMVYGPQILIALIMSVVVAEYADSIEQAATIGILAGLLQILFGALEGSAGTCPISLSPSLPGSSPPSDFCSSSSRVCWPLELPRGEAASSPP